MPLFREILGTVRATAFAAVFVTSGMGLTCVLSGCGNASEGAASASVGDDGKTARTTASVEKKDAADSDKQTAAADGSSDKESDGDDDGEKDKETAVLVRTGTFERRTIDAVLKVHAELWPLESADVLPETTGVIGQVFKREGDPVRTGEVVIQLDDEKLALATEMKKALWEQAQSQVTLAELVVRESDALVETKAVLAEKASVEYERMKQLFEGVGDDSLEGVISKELYDEKRYAHEGAGLDHKTAKIQAEKARVDLEVARQSERQAEIDYRTAVYEQGLKKLKSPIDGHVTFLEKKRGELVSTSEKVFSVVNDRKLEAKLFVPQSKLPDLEVGQRVKIECEVFEGRQFEGRLEVINPVVDRENGMVRVFVGISDEEALAFLRPGMFVSGEIVLKTREDALMVSKRAILFENQQSVIYLVEGDRARRYAVQSDPDFEDLTHVEVRGLLGVDGSYVDPIPSNPAVVLMGQRNLKEGTLVELDKTVGKKQ